MLVFEYHVGIIVVPKVLGIRSSVYIAVIKLCLERRLDL